MNKIASLLFIAVIASFPSASPGARDTKHPRESKVRLSPASTVQNLYAAFGAGNMNEIMSLLDPQIVWIYHAPKSSIPFAGLYKGKDGVAAFFKEDSRFVQVLGNDLKETHEAGDTVFVVGQENGVAHATGTRFSAPWVHMFKVKNGKITRFEEFIDSATISNALK